MWLGIWLSGVVSTLVALGLFTDLFYARDFDGEIKTRHGDPWISTERLVGFGLLSLGAWPLVLGIALGAAVVPLGETIRERRELRLAELRRDRAAVEKEYRQLEAEL